MVNLYPSLFVAYSQFAVRRERDSAGNGVCGGLRLQQRREWRTVWQPDVSGNGEVPCEDKDSSSPLVADGELSRRIGYADWGDKFVVQHSRAANHAVDF